MQKRSVDVVVVSDLHLGTYASRAKEFLAYHKEYFAPPANFEW